MPKLHILSDLHYEFYLDGGRSFTDGLPSAEVTGTDALIVAGDLCPASIRFDQNGLPRALGMLCNKYPLVVFVTGNHEAYGANKPLLDACRAKLLASPRYQNLRWLDHEVCQVKGVRILGTPLWFSESKHAPKHQMNDFHAISDFEEWVYEENRKAKNFLHAELREGDVLITHYLPSQNSVAPQFTGSPLNAFFVCDIEDLIAIRKPQLAIHGHTHSSMRYSLGKTRVVCNPFGYAGHEVNPDFDPGLVIEVKVTSPIDATSKSDPLP
jgi:Icc-related predicted phosphoesterase